MSPILVRPVREQLEHDRIIRLLQAKCRRKYEAGINPGAEQNVPVGSGTSAVYPDVVLQSLERGRRLEGIIEVETGESVNHLEALAEWAHFSKLRAPFQALTATEHQAVASTPAGRMAPKNVVVFLATLAPAKVKQRTFPPEVTPPPARLKVRAKPIGLERDRRS